ncbi:MAG TPA: hypothetical protein VLQ68_02315, partial [Rhizobiaceae bacterium]|nr:hypothetical protein [Rhizobiaceae bacterium]
NIPSKCDRVAVSPGDILYFNTWGGGGWGDPLKRDPLLVLTDMRRGLVTEEGAKRYGVVIRGGKVDGEATARLREDMASRRKQDGLFNRGFSSIEELKARCKAETGFAPPAAPVFRQYLRAAE